MEIKINTDQTNQIIWKGRTARPDALDRIRPAGTVVPIQDYNLEDPVTLVCQSWFPRVWGGGESPKKKNFFLGGEPPPQRGLEGKNQSFRVSRGLEEQEERKEKKKLYRKLSSNI